VCLITGLFTNYSNLQDLRFLQYENVSDLQGCDPLKMEEIHSSKTTVTTYKMAQHHNPEDHNPLFNLTPPVGKASYAPPIEVLFIVGKAA
jgi:hypothetical protein